MPGIFPWSKRRPLSKADNLTTILCHCHVIWEHYVPGNTWATRACSGTGLLSYLSTERKNRVRNQLMLISCTILPSSKPNLPVPKTIHNIITISTFVSQNHMFKHIVHLICTFSNITYTTTKSKISFLH